MQNVTITFIGAGNMAHSLIGGLIADGFPADHLWSTNPEPEALQDLRAKFAIHTTQDNQFGARAADVIVFAVKPQILKAVASELAAAIQEKKPLVISIAAGVREIDLRRWLGEKTAIVRCMPNTPALIRSGATALYANSQVSLEQKNLAESIMRAVGLTLWVTNEQQLDIVTALSGSGPAYFFRVMEALEQAAEELGLPQQAAHLLTLQTALGAARMALESREAIAELRKRVTSPGGTTEAGLQVLNTNSVDKLFADVLKAAQQRSIELAELFGAN
jgi:pyrroline-5-carboxylate reductase